MLPVDFSVGKTSSPSQFSPEISVSADISTVTSTVVCAAVIVNAVSISTVGFPVAVLVVFRILE